MVSQDSEREHRILERILTLKQLRADGFGGPAECHELSVAYYCLRNFAPALESIDELVRSYPDYVEIGAVYALQALLLVETADYERAEPLLDRRIELYPTDTKLRAMRAFVFEKTGRVRQAIQEHRAILDMDPDNLNSLNGLGYLLALHAESKEEREEALRVLSRALKSKPEYAPYLDSLGVYFAADGDFRRAHRALMKALEIEPDNGEVIDHLRELVTRMRRSRAKSD